MCLEFGMRCEKVIRMNTYAHKKAWFVCGLLWSMWATGRVSERANERFVHAYTANRYKNEQMELLIWALNTVAVSDLENNDVQRTIHIIIKNKRHTQRLSVLFDTIRFEGNGNNWDFSAIKFSFTSFSTSLRRMSHFWNRISNKQFWASVRSTRIDEYHRQTELILFLFPTKS